MSFPLYLDEDQTGRTARGLTRAGYDVLTTQAAGRAGRGASDESQLEFAASLGRAIVTSNSGDYYPLFDKWWTAQRHHSGIITVSRRPSPEELVARLVHLQQLYPDGISDLILQA